MRSKKVRDLITGWLIDEGFEVRNFTLPEPAEVVWGLDVFTPPPLRVNLKIFKPKDRRDRVMMILGVGISPEHLRRLAKLGSKGRLSFSSKLLRNILSVCNYCSVAIQPNPIDPQAVTVGIAVFDSEVHEDSKPRFLEKVMLLVNTFLAIISTFNEEFPVVGDEGMKPGEGTTTRL